MKVDTEEGRPVRERGRDVVAVADKGERAAGQCSPPFPKRDEIGERLARMLLIGQRVDHVEPAGGRSEFGEHGLRKRADDHGVNPPLQISGDVGHRFAPAERHIRLQRDDLAAQLAHGDLEG